jgi:hypothetical protein
LIGRIGSIAGGSTARNIDPIASIINHFVTVVFFIVEGGGVLDTRPNGVNRCSHRC